MTQNLSDSPLGKPTQYLTSYSPGLLFPISRAEQRRKMGIGQQLPFRGVDIWNAYEVSWLNSRGKPQVAIARCAFPCESECIIESKSFKLYLYSLNQTRFADAKAVTDTFTRDLSSACGAPVQIKLITAADFAHEKIQEFSGICLDNVDVTIERYTPYPDYLTTRAETVHESIYSNLMRSNCLVTQQPDWGTVMIEYVGKKIEHAGLLKYIISFREHQEFHEPCAEHLFVDIQHYCQPEKLTVSINYTRRGGLDINPFRSNFAECDFDQWQRVARQ